MEKNDNYKLIEKFYGGMPHWKKEHSVFLDILNQDQRSYEKQSRRDEEILIVLSSLLKSSK